MTVRHYSKNGFKFTYPSFLKLEDKFSIFTLSDPNTKYAMVFSLDPKEWTFDYSCKIRIGEPEILEKNLALEVLRLGDYAHFPKAKECLTKRNIYNNKREIEASFFQWTLVIPFGKRILSIGVKDNNLDRLDTLWKPIINTIGFDATKYDVQSQSETSKRKSYDWTRSLYLKKSRHFKHTFHPSFAFIALYDSAVEYDSSIMLELNNDTGAIATGVIQDLGQLTLLTRRILEVMGEFYYNEKAPNPDDNKWEHVLEGVININSGKMFLDDGESVDVEILMEGNYTFRIYYELMPSECKALKIKFYFWKTENEETKYARIIKQSKNLFPVVSS
ncbi:hypothetical protein LJB99_04890 [Deltaproteobacteria bacterium OttesenSCG-928-K17]|nr:hypothetical protein [Deltaproteobacteria bacterium OttesenSCG-928-K17]